MEITIKTAMFNLGMTCVSLFIEGVNNNVITNDMHEETKIDKVVN